MLTSPHQVIVVQANMELIQIATHAQQEPSVPLVDQTDAVVVEEARTVRPVPQYVRHATSVITR